MRYIRRRDDIYELIAKNIKKERCRKKMTQAELARKAGYSHVTIRKIESNNLKKYFSIDTVCNIADALDIDVGDLLINREKK